ncbi:L-threonylcarbamoyladenylate synthase [Evansella cellulosilytica]|uniref:Threonylcarbamoyl-AMP synthase n=1 Tax=Evansella cellulosilytica (strain ATCC 21833 / DSM 2522 / FERM P-1141 / JCM 9156 / N-4) TaxID=649639 RepID=E6TXC3_EVAC2|nr:L-threonylcarbamoyladenylate synthase [Evansella cellulosilytica]ADU32318.1 Sua5/YciO/YrdC/YwlC family protein [Evansella cellulosilytica DSM 2522]
MTNQQTNILSVDNSVENLKEHPLIQCAATQLASNEVVAFPTETVYGLGGNALSDQAIERIFKAKGRPSDNPLIVHISNKKQLQHYVKHIPNSARKLIDAFWPGPLTIVLEHNKKLSTRVTAQLSTVAVRMPDHPVALALIEAANVPLAAPSANTSGKPSPTTADHVRKDLAGKISTIIDGGTTGVGVESTVVDCTSETVMLLRPGGISKEALEEIVGVVEVDPALVAADHTPKSPGMKYTHYAPDAPLQLIDGSTDFFRKIVEDAINNGKKVGVLVTEENKGLTRANQEVILGKRSDLSTVAQTLYSSLRSFDKNVVDIIFTEVFPETGLGSAIMNRLKKAAGGTIIKQD